MDETILYARLRTHIEEWGACSRVENIVEGGMFDIFYCIEGRMGWIETKIEHNGKILFERFQFPWARKYQRVGARLFVIVQLKNGDIAIYPIDEILKAPREQYQKWLRLNISDLAAIDILSKPFYWARLRQVLVS